MIFLIDMPLSQELAVWLARQGHDAVHAVELGLDRAADSENIEYAHNENRIIITADLDYPRLLALARPGRTWPDTLPRWKLQRTRIHKST